MTSSPPITVLLPCHSLNYLNQAVESIANQTIAKEIFEVLIVADRVDEALVRDMVSKHKIRYRVLKSPEPGIVSALNFGLENTASELIARMDEDDVMYPDRLASQKAFLDKNKDFGAIGGQLELIDNENSTIGFSNYLTEFEIDSLFAFVRSPLPHPATMFRRELVVQLGGYRDFLPEDWDLWVRINKRSKLGNLKKVILKYRIHQQQLSRHVNYASPRGSSFVEASHLARISGLRDSPSDHQNPDEWIKDLQKDRKFLQSKKVFELEKKLKKRSFSRIKTKLLFDSKSYLLISFLQKDFLRHMPIVIKTFMHKARIVQSKNI